MRVPALLLAISLAVTLLALMLPALQDLLLVSLPSVSASLILLLRTLFTGARGPARGEPVILDGSNILYWENGEPRIETVRKVLSHLLEQGYAPGVIFDANVGYIVSGSYMHDGTLAKSLGVSRDRVMVVPKGTPADPAILTAARDLGARIVTNDRYRDWAGDYPEISQPGYLIHGALAGGKVSLDL